MALQISHGKVSINDQMCLVANINWRSLSLSAQSIGFIANYLVLGPQNDLFSVGTAKQI